MELVIVQKKKGNKMNKKKNNLSTFKRVNTRVNMKIPCAPSYYTEHTQRITEYDILFVISQIKLA